MSAVVEPSPGTPSDVVDVGRERPALHFTAAAGWTNDPYGVIHRDGTYHMFFQYVPGRHAWAPNCHWGHATSADLITWHEEPLALVPAEGLELGCWSGSAVWDGETPTLLYTRVNDPDWGKGQVALARGSADLRTWVRAPVSPVIEGPPAELGGYAFRDPFVWHSGDTWQMVLGIGLPDGSGAALRYTSDDLLDWRYEGVLARRHTEDRDGVWTGKLWECPQLFPLGDSWVLLVSVWDDDVLHYVAYAVGDLRDGRFEARRWARFSQGGAMYAASAFLDAQGERCTMSWFREAAGFDATRSPWASAVSLPHVLYLDGDRLRARPHPNVEHALPVCQRWEWSGSLPVQVAEFPGVGLVTLDYGLGERAEVDLEWSTPGGETLLRVTVSPGFATGDRHLAAVSRTGTIVEAEVRGGHGRLYLVVDADMLECSGTGLEGIAEARGPLLAGTQLRVSASGDGEGTLVLQSASSRAGG